MIMDTSLHTMPNLFQQLGLSNDEQAINDFVRSHQLPNNVLIQHAGFWSAAQTAFIEECLDDDSDWAEVVDQLNAQLHS